MLGGIAGISSMSGASSARARMAYTPDDVNIVREQLMAPRWSRLVTVDSKRDRELVEIYGWRKATNRVAWPFWLPNRWNSPS